MPNKLDKLVRFALLAPFVAAMVIHGSTKPPPGPRPSRFTFDQYLEDTGSYSTNDLVHVAATKTYLMIPDSTPLYVYAALAGTTNWTELTPRRTYSDLPADWTLANATNYDYIVMLDWAPPTPVVTNDILLVNALAAKDSTPPGATLAAVLPQVALVTPIEYLESTGTQWIDTGMVARPGYDFEYKVNFLQANEASFVGGFYSATQSVYIGLRRANGNFAYWYGNNGALIEIQSLQLNVDYNITAHLHIGEQYYSINGRKSSVGNNPSVFASAKNMLLFAINQSSGPTNPSKLKLYYLQAWYNGVLVRDFIPMRVGRVGCLFDRVSGELFGNAGTGAFILGPDITE